MPDIIRLQVKKNTIFNKLIIQYFLSGQFHLDYPNRFHINIHVPQLVDYTHPQDKPMGRPKKDPPYIEARIRIHKIGPTSYYEEHSVSSSRIPGITEIKNRNGDGDPLKKSELKLLLNG